MNTAPDFAKLYINWLKKKIVLKDMGDYQEITTPFLDKNNDHMQIFVKPHSDGQCILSDAGSTINELALSGVTINTQKRRELLNFIINKHGISFDPATETLYSVTDIKDFAHKKHALLQAMLAVDDMFMVAHADQIGRASCRERV